MEWIQFAIRLYLAYFTVAIVIITIAYLRFVWRDNSETQKQNKNNENEKP